MDSVYAKIKGQSQRELRISEIRNGTVAEKDIEVQCCIGCCQPTHVMHSKLGTQTFRAKQHKPNCRFLSPEYQEDERLKAKCKTFYTGVILCNDLILNGNDRAPASADNNKAENPDGPIVPPITTPDELENMDLDYYYKYSEKMLSCIGSVFSEIKKEGCGFKMGENETARDLLLDDIALLSVRQKGFEGRKIAMLKRCNRKDLEYLNKIGLYESGKSTQYVILKDAFSEKPENTIYFKLKCKHTLQNEYFKDLILGSKKYKKNPDSKRYIVVYTVFKRMKNDYNQVYYAEITFRQYYLTNDIRIGG